MGIGPLDAAGNAVNNDGLADEFFSVKTRRRVPNVKIHPTCITIGCSLDDAWVGYQVDPFPESRAEK